MGINIGEYIRTKNHGIKKVDRINEKATKNKYIVYEGIDKEGDEYFITINIDEIISHSENLIDLIEVGDFVNRNFIEDIDEDDGELILKYNWNEEYGILDMKIKNDEIISVLTKEQYNKNCYKVEV